MLAFPSSVKYIRVPPHDRIFASRIADRTLIDVTPRPSADGPITTAIRALGQSAAVEIRHWLPWRVDDCKILAVADPEDAAQDAQVGVMESPELANEAVMAHNVSLREVDRWPNA